MWRLIASVSVVLPDTSKWAARRWDLMRRTLVSLAPRSRGRVSRCRWRSGALFIEVQPAFEQGLDLGFAESAVSTRRADAADATGRCPSGHRLRVYPEQR